MENKRLWFLDFLLTVKGKNDKEEKFYPIQAIKEADTHKKSAEEAELFKLFLFSIPTFAWDLAKVEMSYQDSRKFVIDTKNTMYSLQKFISGYDFYKLFQIGAADNGFNLQDVIKIRLGFHQLDWRCINDSDNK